MVDPNDHFVALQAATLARLTATDATVPAPVPNAGAITYLSETKGDIVNAVAKAIGSIGIVAIVLTPEAALIDPAADDLGMYAPLLIQVQENVLVNQGAGGTKIPALRLVAFIMKRLQGWSHRIYVGDESAQRVRLDPKPFKLIRDEPPLTYNVAATAMLDLSATLR